MAALVEGCNYGLSSLASTSADKSVVHVKLTDSALRAIEEFQKIKDVQTRKPIIQFMSDRGIIRVPIKKSSDNPEGYRTFSFFLSVAQGDPNGSFDCIKHSASSNGDHLEVLGPLAYKLSVQATDDVYKTTRERMTLAEEESKKQCAKEIKPGGPNIGRRIKKVVRRPDLPPHKSRTDMDSNHGGSSHHKPTSGSSLTMSSSHKSSITPRVGPGSGSLGSSHVSSSQKVPGGSGHSPQYPVVSSNSVGSTAKTSVPSPSQSSGKSSPNPAVFNMPYRDRVMHLLAIRPYKKPELLARLQRDGVREKDRNSLSQVLGQVAVFGRDNSYSLGKHLISEIRIDWPGYSDNERKILKKRLSQVQESHSAGSSPAATSPAHSLSSQGSPTSSQKRPTSTTDEDALPMFKKARIAHVKKDGDFAKREPSPKESSKPVKQEATTTTLSPDSSNDDVRESQKSKEKQHSRVEMDTAKFDATSTSETPDYVLDYTAITSADQRIRYKQSFNCEYDEYRVLHANIDKVTKRFKELEASLRKEEEGSDNYENIKNKILNEYKHMKRDPKYKEQRSRCNYLHKKLAHVKRLIHEYDQNQLIDS